MARISVVDARAFATILTQGADEAQAAGETDFDLGAAAEAAQNQGLSDLNAAIDAARKAQTEPSSES
jgi:hypothetical protein